MLGVCFENALSVLTVILTRSELSSVFLRYKEDYGPLIRFVGVAQHVSHCMCICIGTLAQAVNRSAPCGVSSALNSVQGSEAASLDGR